MHNTRRFVVLLSVIALTPMTAAAAKPAVQKPKQFANCTAMHKTYAGGVARVGAHDKRKGGGHAAHRPYVSTALYNANSRLDRDGDGIGCEQ